LGDLQASPCHARGRWNSAYDSYDIHKIRSGTTEGMEPVCLCLQEVLDDRGGPQKFQ
jgi:hypothetical protein